MIDKLDLKLGQTMLLIVDVQERLAPAMDAAQYGRLLKNMERFAGAREALGLEVVISEQYPKGLGPTVEPLQQAFEGVAALPKVSFSAYGDEGLKKAIDEAGCKSIVVAGMETHICVYQTARALAENFSVHVLADGVASRTAENYQVGLELIKAAGGIVTSTETVLFDLLERAGSDAFKTVSKLVR